MVLKHLYRQDLKAISVKCLNVNRLFLLSLLCDLNRKILTGYVRFFKLLNETSRDTYHLNNVIPNFVAFIVVTKMALSGIFYIFSIFQLK